MNGRRAGVLAALLGLPVLGYGFRPFFLASGVLALVSIPAWLWIHAAGVSPVAGIPGQLWHGHEMLFGFAGAVVAGFLLSAVPSWTRHRGFGGLPVLMLALVWLAGRLAFALGQAVPPGALALVELAFLPLLAGFIAPPILRQRNRNMAMLAVLAVLWSADAVFLAGALAGDAQLASRALLAALNVLLLLITVVGGRLVPAFTSNALRRADTPGELRTTPWVEASLPVSMLLVIAIDGIRPGSALAGVVGLAAALLHGWRLSGWHSLRTGREPIVWVLHVAYGWLPVGFALKAIALLGGAGWALYWQHALAVGTVATMITGVMTRTVLGHTGRPLVAGPASAAAFALLTLATFVRVFAPPVWPDHYGLVLLVAGLCWAGAFSLFLAVYGPMLVTRRADGRSG